MNLYNENCPVKTKTISYKDDLKPWIDRETKQKIKKRQSYFLLYKKGRMGREVYNRYRNMVTSTRGAPA